MTAWTLILQFIKDYLVFFIIAGIIVVGLIVANVVFAVLSHKKKRKQLNNDSLAEQDNLREK